MFTGYFDIKARPHDQAKGIVPVAQNAWELEELAREYSIIRPQAVMEIGSQHGGTLRRFMQESFVADIETVFVSVDTGPKSWHPPQDFDVSIWHEWAEQFRCKLHIVQANSHEISTLQEVKDIRNEYDFIFVDGDHSYEGAMQDFEMYGPLVRKGGIMAFHDIATPDFSPHIQVWQAWREIQAAGYKTREIRANGPFGGIGVVYL